MVSPLAETADAPSQLAKLVNVQSTLWRPKALLSGSQALAQGMRSMAQCLHQVSAEPSPPTNHVWDIHGDIGCDADTNKKGGGMGKIDDACKEVVDAVDGSVACGVVDLDSGLLLGIHNNSQYTSTLNEVVAAATMDLFRGANVGRIEQMVRSHRGVPEDGEHYFHEVHVTSSHNFHFAKAIKDGKAVMMLVTKKTTNVGMGWAQLKAAIPKVEPHVP